MNSKAQNAATAYRAASIENAPPLKIVQLLYDGALRFLGQAEQCDPKTEVQAFHRALNKVDAIVAELRFSLDESHAPELCQQLESLYLFVEDQIREAFLTQDKAPLAVVRRVLQPLGSAWKEIDESKAAA